jgi:hypothetical protein
MDYFRGTRSKVGLFLLAVLAAGVLLSSCRSKVSKETDLSGDIDDGNAVEAGVPPGIEITALLLPGREDIGKRFKTYLPDSGIVPVEVTLKNNSGRTICMRATNGFPLPEIYSGFILEHDGKRFMLLSPFEVLSLMRAEGKSLRYRKPGIFDAVVGVAFPPSLFYYGYKEVSIGRLYRALYKNSLYPARKSGVLEPLRIEPGGEAKGFLYFFVLPEDSPYPTESNDIEDGVALPGKAPMILVQPTAPLETGPDTLDIRDAMTARVENAAHSKDAGGDRKRVVFALGLTGRWKMGDVLVGDLYDVLHQSGESVRKVSSYSSSKGRIIDASTLGGHAACVVNFKSSSKVCVADLNAGSDAGETFDLDRRAVRVILTEDGFITMTEDGECRFTRYGEKLTARKVRMGKLSRDLFLDGDRIVLLSKESVSFLGASGENLLKRYDRIPLSEGRRRFIGRDGSNFYIIHESNKLGGDTLAVYDADTFEERWRIPLPGEIEYTEMESGLLLQIEDGTILHMFRDTASDTLRIDAMGYAPVPAGGIVYRDDGFTVMGKDGVILEGGQTPRVIPGLVTRVPVTVKQPPPKSSRPR